MGYVGKKTLATQTTIFEEAWPVSDASDPLRRDTSTPVTGVPAGAVQPGLPPTSDELREGRIPYWEFIWQIDSAQGLVITDAVVRDTLPRTGGTPSTERVFQRIDFTDLVVTFDDGSTEPFNVGRAWAAPGASFRLRRNGARNTTSTPDRLFQYGLCLTLTDNVLAGRGTCNVTLEFVVAFRGATNDFDPGGVPVAMGCYPQLAWSWSSAGATKRVEEFRGSVRITVDNVMAHAGHGAAPPENIAGFFTDSNTAFGTSLLNMFTRANIYGTRIVRIASVPGSWGMLFDYFHANFTQEKEIVGVYGPNDGNFYTAATPRRATYLWPSTPGNDDYNRYLVNKVARQGQYDNIHLHADMGRPDRYGNPQIHAPFCGHSCVHMHWRWSGTAGDGANERSWYYYGWSSPPAGGIPRAHSEPGGPLVPPNQRIMVAVCAPRAARHDTDHIINPAALGLLPVRNKMVWYTADIIKPAAGQKQVICEHGLGWAYRYAMQDESRAVQIMALAGAFRPLLSSAPSTQAQMSDFFENYVYPDFRYLDWFGTRINQIPNGDYARTHVWGSRTPATPIKAEDL